MTDSEEHAYAEGRKAFARRMLVECLRELHVEGVTAEKLILERAETIAFLRGLCARCGDNDWSDNLHLVDVLEKHLERHLPQRDDAIARKLLAVCADVLPWAECAIDAGISEGPGRVELVESALANHTILLRLRAVIKDARAHFKAREGGA